MKLQIVHFKLFCIVTLSGIWYRWNNPLNLRCCFTINWYDLYPKVHRTVSIVVFVFISYFLCFVKSFNPPRYFQSELFFVFVVFKLYYLQLRSKFSCTLRHLLINNVTFKSLSKSNTFINIIIFLEWKVLKKKARTEYY